MIIITGAAGFIGSCILARFNKLGRRDIIIVDHLEKDDPKELNLKNKKYAKYYDKQEFIELIRRDSLKDSVEAVIHMGACSSTVLQDARYYEENNYLYSRDLGQWCRDHNVRFIYASSAATYGDGALGYKDDDATSRRLKPLNLYGESKQKFDLWVLDNNLARTFVGLKFFNVFGPNEYHKGDMRSVIAKTFQDVVKEGKIRLFKSYRKEYAHGEQKRDFIYISDSVDIVMFFYEHPSLGGIYNVGTGLARSWNDLAKALFAALGRQPVIEYFDMPGSLREQYQYFTQADMTKLRQAGYRKAFLPLEDTIKDYTGYLQHHKYL